MLNVLRSSKLEFRKSFIETMMALGLGVVMATVMIALQELDAQRELAAHSFNVPNIGAEQQEETLSESDVAQVQLDLVQLKSRVQYLMRRQEEREDLMDVQAIFMAQVSGPKGAVGELNSLQWQHGMLEFEGLTLPTEDWHTLLSEINLFDRWQTAPQIFRAHRGLSKSSPSVNSQVAKRDSATSVSATSVSATSELATPQVEIKLKAKLWAHASNSLLSKSAP